MSLFSFQGKLRIGKRNANGKPKSLLFAGNVPTCTVQLAAETTDKNESSSGQRLQIGRLPRSKTATLTGSFDEWIKRNLALGLYSTDLVIAAGSVTGEALPADAADGDVIRLDHPFVDDVVLTDSEGTPATVDPEHYRIESANGGLIELLNVVGYEPPLVAAYEHLSAEVLTIFTAQPEEVFVQLDAINTENGSPVIVELYRVRFDPFAELPMINEEYGTLPFTAAVLADMTADLDPLLGNFGRIIGRGS